MSATVIYVHGAGNKPPASELKQAWDRDLFGRDMAQQTRMAHYADLLHARPGSIGPDACTLEQAFAALIALAGEEGEALSMDADEARDRVRAEDADLFRKRFGSAMSKHAKTIFDDYQASSPTAWYSLVERAARQPPESPTFKEITVNGTGRTRVREACRRTNTR